MKLLLLFLPLSICFHDLALERESQSWSLQSARIVERNLSQEKELPSQGIDRRLRFVLVREDEREVRYELWTRRKLILSGKGVCHRFVYTRIETDFELYS